MAQHWFIIARLFARLKIDLGVTERFAEPANNNKDGFCALPNCATSFYHEAKKVTRNF